MAGDGSLVEGPEGGEVVDEVRVLVDHGRGDPRRALHEAGLRAAESADVGRIEAPVERRQGGLIGGDGVDRGPAYARTRRPARAETVPGKDA